MSNWFEDAIAGAANVMKDVEQFINPFYVEGEFESGGGFKADLESPNTQPLGRYLTKSTESFFEAVNWVYSNAISQPIATLGLQARRPTGELFSATEWSRAWRAAEHISLGQAAMLPGSGLGSLTSGDFTSEGAQRAAEEAMSSPLLYFTPPAAYLPPNWNEIPVEEQQRMLRDAGMPVVGNEYIEQLRQASDVYKYGTGTVDFMARFWADPTIIGGKAVGAVRTATVVKTRPRGGWTPTQIDKLVDSSQMGRLHDWLYANRHNPQLINNSDFAQKSVMGPRMGAIVSQLRSPDEVQDFIRVGMGDTQALTRLRQQNLLAGARIDQDTSRLAAIEVSYARYAKANDPRMVALAKAEMDRLNAAISADTAMVSRYDEIMSHADEIDTLHLSRWSFARAEARTEAQNQYLASAARGGKAGRQLNIKPTPVAWKGAQPVSQVRSGFVKTRLWGVGDFFTTPVTAVRMMKNVHPNGYLSVDQGAAFEAASMAELRAHVARIPGISQQQRATIINDYLKTTNEAERIALLDDISTLAAGKMAEKHGLDPQAGLDIWKFSQERMNGFKDDMRQYSAAEQPRPGEPALRVDAFEVEGGVVIAPPTVSRIMNSYALQDLDALNKVLARNASVLKTIRTSRAGNPDWVLAAGDRLNTLWKFGTLFRLGYIPRTIGDDIASQMARLGAVAMAMRIGYGVKNGITNLAHREARPFNEAMEKIRLQEVEYANSELKLLQPQIKRSGGRLAAESAMRDRDVLMAENRLQKAELRRQNMPANATPGQVAAMDRFVQSKLDELSRARTRQAKPLWPGKTMSLRDMELREAELVRLRDLSQKAADDLAEAQKKVYQGANPIEVDGQVFPSAFGGQRGDYYMQRISPSAAYDQLFKNGKEMVHSNLMRSFDQGARPIKAIDDEAKHAAAWSHAVNAQITGDALQRQIVAGASDAEALNWLTKTAQGIQYWKRLGLRFADPEEVIAKLRYEVDDYLPLPEIRQKALTPEGVTPEFLQKAVPNPLARPTVHMANIGNNSIDHMRTIDRVMASFYNVAVNIPAKRLSRQPLYNQLYEGHLRTIVAQRKKAGQATTSVADVERVTEVARRLAERDTKSLVFDIAHRSDAAAALRFVSPFFAATTESFQRWARVLADKPETIGYAANFYNAPAYLGAMQDQEGNRIFPDGHIYTIDPKTGQGVRKLVPKGDRFIISRLPDWLIDSPVGVAFGVERSSGKLTLSQNSMNIVTQGDPWFSPGVGPVVQIPVNEWVKDKPDQAELARQLGVLPFGPASGETAVSRAARQAVPGTLRNFLTAFDTSDYRYQQVKMQIMQRAIYEHEEQSKPMLSAEEISDRARNYWLFSAGSAFLQPMATQRKDAYQFYRDQYNNLRRANPETADQEFLDRFGEEYFIFAQSMSKNVAGIPATKKAVELSKEYADVLAEFPELGSLIIGPEGNGPFSPEAYAYQLNTPLVPGDAESQRRRMTAEEAVDENERRKGWSKFSKFMNYLNYQVQQRGLNTLEDKGAEDLVLMKRAFISMNAEPLGPDGEVNPFYNEQWSKDWFSFDARKYDRMIPALDSAAKKILAKDPERGDMRSLLMYIQGRKAIQAALAQREFHSLGARANTALRQGWVSFVGGLTESNTDFEDLHSRYLSRDLGIDIDEEEEALQSLEADVR